MASFCAQCSIDIWGHDDKDYAGQTTEEQTKARVYAVILCEGCGPTWADHRGFCVNPRCPLDHGVLVEEAETGDLLEAKPFEYNDAPVEMPDMEQGDWDKIFAKAEAAIDEAFPPTPEPVGKEWLEGLSEEDRERVGTGQVDADGPYNADR